MIRVAWAAAWRPFHSRSPRIGLIFSTLRDIVEVALLRRSEAAAASFASQAPRAAVSEMLRALTTKVVAVATDLGRSEVSYYFQNEEPQLALASQLPWVLALARAAEDPEQEPLVRHYGTRLRLAVEKLLDDVGRRYLRMRDAPANAVLAALARDQLLPAPAGQPVE